MNNIIQICITYRKIIDSFLNYPAREFTINELSHLSETSYATTWRIIQKLDQAGLIFTKRIGHSTVCTLNASSPFLKEVKEILDKKLTPQEAVLSDFVNGIKDLDFVQKIILFGSVAKGNAKLNSDIDIVVVVAKKDEKTEKYVIEVTDKILTSAKMRVIPLVMTQNEIKQNKQFADELTGGKTLYERITGS